MIGNMKLIHAVDKNNHKNMFYYCFILEDNKLSLCLSQNKKSNEYLIVNMDIQKTKTPYGYIIDGRRSTAFWDLRFYLFKHDYLLISEKSKVMNDMHREIIRLERLVKESEE